MISETEARQTVLALGTAMFADDKAAREVAYSDLSEDDLKRVIRWAMRQLIAQFAFISSLQGQDPVESWSEMAMQYNLFIANEGDK